jgi:hypothetical protein
MSQVPALVQLHSHDSITGLKQGEVNGHVGLSAAVGLDVGVLGVEKLFGAFNRQTLHHVHILAAAVIASAGVSLGVFIVHYSGLGFQHRFAGVVFGSDQHNAVPLPLIFLLDGPGHLRVLPHE